MLFQRPHLRRVLLFGSILLFNFLMISCLLAQSGQTKKDLNGHVRDARSGEALPYANVLLKGTNRGTTTNTEGYFILVNVPVGICSLQVAYIGYETQNLKFDNSTPRVLPLIVKMSPKIIEMAGVMVTAPMEMLDAASKQVSQLTLAPRQLSTLPSIGEVDVFRTLQLLPGISAANEGQSGLYVRGGTPDQNLVLFDGMTIYHVDHFFGFFSAFNADAIKDIQLFKGGFPAEYGGRISSVVNLTGKTGNSNRRQLGYGVNLLSAHAFFETPLWNKGTFLIAGRRSYTDFLRSPLYNSIYKLMTGDESSVTMGGPPRFGGGPGQFGGNQMAGEFQPAFYFYDLNAKLTLNPSSKDVLAFSVYSGKDDLDKSQTIDNAGFRQRGTETNVAIENKDYTRWGNLGFSGKWSRQWHDRLHVDLLGAHSTYFSQYDRSTGMDALAPVAGDSIRARRSLANATKEENTVKDLSAKLDVDWQLAHWLRLDFGVHVNQFDNQFQANRNDSIEILKRNNQSWLYSAYLQNNWKPFEPFEVTLGLRASQYEKIQKMYYEPRAAFNYQLTRNFQFKGAWGQYYQFVNRIANEDVTQGARDFWLLADADIHPCYAEHQILGINYENQTYLFSIEGYHKNLKDILEFSRRFVSRRGEPMENFFSGTGQAEGIEFLLQKKRGALTGWLDYTLGRVNYLFPGMNNGQEFPASQDRRHELKLVTKYNLGVYTLAATWVFASGNPYTAPESQYFIPLLNGEVNSYIHVSDKNSQRLPDYHRLDVSASRRFTFGSWDLEAGLSVFNVYNHKNVWYRDYNLDTVPIAVTDVLLLGITPTFFIQMNLK